MNIQMFTHTYFIQRNKLCGSDPKSSSCLNLPSAWCIYLYYIMWYVSLSLWCYYIVTALLVTCYEQVIFARESISKNETLFILQMGCLKMWSLLNPHMAVRWPFNPSRRGRWWNSTVGRRKGRGSERNEEMRASRQKRFFNLTLRSWDCRGNSSSPFLSLFSSAPSNPTLIIETDTSVYF